MNRRFRRSRYALIPDVLVLLLGIGGVLVLDGVPRALCGLALFCSVAGVIVRGLTPLFVLKEDSIAVARVLHRRRIVLTGGVECLLTRDFLTISDRGRQVLSIPLDELGRQDLEELAAILRDRGAKTTTEHIRVEEGPRSDRAHAWRLATKALPASVVFLVGVGLLQARTPLTDFRRPSDEGVSPGAGLSALPATSRECLSIPTAEKYVEALHRRLQTSWDATPRSSGKGFVAVAFILDSSGAVRHSRVIGESNSEFRFLGQRVLEQSAPFGSLAGALECLTRIELRATLESEPLAG